MYKLFQRSFMAVELVQLDLQCDPTASCKSILHNLKSAPNPYTDEHTKIVSPFTRTSTTQMTRFILRTSYIWGMPIPNIMEEMHLWMW